MNVITIPRTIITALKTRSPIPMTCPCFLLFPAISLPPYHNALSEIFLLNLFARITMINATTDSKSPAATDSP